LGTLSAAALTGLGLLSATAQAQVRTLEEVVVTAQKRAQSIQDFSGSIAALSGAEMAETGMNSFADYFASVPSLTMVEKGPGLTTLAIRGITTGGVRNDEPQNKETVGVYIDETPIAINGFNPDLGLYDIERVEVLRGPQGTLYGSGSLGGTIRIITNKPNFDQVEGSGEVMVSQTHRGESNNNLKGAINVPLLVDSLALRAMAYRNDLGGYLDNEATGEDDANTALTTGGRLQLGARLGDRLDANLTYMRHELETGSRSEQRGGYSFATRAFDGLDDENDIFNLTFNYAFDNATLTSATSYLDKRLINRISLEFVLADALGYDSASPLVDTTEVEDISQELRLASAAEGRWTWVVGAFYQHRDRYYEQNGRVPGIDAFIGVPSEVLGTPGPDNIFYGTQIVEQTQGALFGEVSFDVNSKLTATVGMRYFDYDEDYSTYSSGLLNSGPSSSEDSLSEDGFTPRFNLSYFLNENSMLYAEAAKGFRLGGVNTTVPQDLCAADLAELGRTDSADTFDSDSVWNYEVGSKNELLSRRLTVNGSLYYIDWEDMQTTLSLPSCSFSFRTNAASARSIGMELEMRFAATDALELSGTLGVTDSQLKEDVPFTTWQKGDHAPGVPRMQFSAGLRYAFDLFGIQDAFVRADYSYSGEADTQFDSSAPGNREYGDYHLLNLRMGARLPDFPADIAVFVSNALDSDGKVQATAETTARPESFVTLRPRTIGFTLSTRF
tara:strand:+ start:27931 stop:30114 length:2184 start_codon:yes stop_codon:yes gene_type:complete